MSYKSMGY